MYKKVRCDVVYLFILCLIDNEFISLYNYMKKMMIFVLIDAGENKVEKDKYSNICVA